VNVGECQNYIGWAKKGRKEMFRQVIGSSNYVLPKWGSYVGATIIKHKLYTKAATNNNAFRALFFVLFWRWNQEEATSLSFHSIRACCATCINDKSFKLELRCKISKASCKILSIKLSGIVEELLFYKHNKFMSFGLCFQFFDSTKHERKYHNK
jgi:hypothetical protein